MKKSLLTLTAVLALSAFAAAPKLNISGQKTPGEVVEKDGVYTVTPSKIRIQLYPKLRQPVYTNVEIEIIAEVSGSGNIQLGYHGYDRRGVWKNGYSSKTIRVDAEETETVKQTLKVENKDIVSVTPYISVFSGPVKVESVAIRVIGGLDASNIADAPKCGSWNYVPYSRALKCNAAENGGVNIVTGAGQLTEFVLKNVAAKDGDTYQFDGEFTGKGNVSIGLHLYDKRRVWQGAVWAQVKVNGKNGKLPLLTVKTPKGKQQVTSIVPVFRVVQNSDITCKSVSVKKTN